MVPDFVSSGTEPMTLMKSVEVGSTAEGQNMENRIENLSHSSFSSTVFIVRLFEVYDLRPEALETESGEGPRNELSF